MLLSAALASSLLACAPSGLGDPCTPEKEYSATSGASQAAELSVDVNSTQCDTRVCLSHYFSGRVTCPYGNGMVFHQQGKCRQVGDRRGYFTLDGVAGGTVCCPIPGDLDEAPITLPVPAQCSKRPAKDAVYCSCRCDVPDDPELDRSQLSLCKCSSGFSCVPLFDRHNAPNVKGRWGSYCVKDDQKSFDPDKQTEACGALLTP